MLSPTAVLVGLYWALRGRPVAGSMYSRRGDERLPYSLVEHRGDAMPSLEQQHGPIVVAVVGIVGIAVQADR